MMSDPMVRAGRVVCPRCGRVAFPSDAVWLDDRLILAVFPPGCEHHEGGEWVIDLDAPDQPSPWCGATTRSGDPCRRRRSPGGTYCRDHARRSTRERGR